MTCLVEQWGQGQAGVACGLPWVRGANNIPPIGQMGKLRPLFRIIRQMSSVEMGVWRVGTESPAACLAPPAPASATARL